MSEIDFEDAFIPVSVWELDPGTPIKYLVTDGDGSITIQPTEAVFLGTRDGAVRLKGVVPDREGDEVKEYKLGRKRIEVMERLDEDPWDEKANYELQDIGRQNVE